MNNVLGDSRACLDARALSPTYHLFPFEIAKFKSAQTRSPVTLRAAAACTFTSEYTDFRRHFINQVERALLDVQIPP